MEPLDMSRFPGCGEFDVERSALPGGRPHINLSRVLFDNTVAHREPQAGAATVGLEGIARIQYATARHATDDKACAHKEVVRTPAKQATGRVATAVTHRDLTKEQQVHHIT